jgi:N-acetylmuramoyl-L-alanine amidase
MKRMAKVIRGALVLLAVTPGLWAQEPSVQFRFDGQVIEVPQLGDRIELMPVLALLGAEARFSPAAGTYGVVYEEHFIQFAPDRQLLLVDGELTDPGEKPVPSPGGVAASVRFLERALLAPLGYHLETVSTGYAIAPGARVGDPVVIRPAAADFATTTTLVLTLSRSTPAQVEPAPDGAAVVLFADATPQLDASIPFRSGRVLRLRAVEQLLRVELADGIGVVTWHELEDPPRVILELGRIQPTPTPAPTQVLPERPPVAPIVIDPGHGGDDTGAVSASGLMEKELVLDIAIRLARLLGSRGHFVRLTRTGDEARALTDRTAMANRLEAKLFVSLHANASTASSVRGAETYYMSLDQSATDEAAAATARLENRAGDGEPAGSPLDLILWELAQAEVLNESARLALGVQRRLNETLELRDRGVKQAPFVVLTGATMPAVLIEVGFLSNTAEESKLRDDAHRDRIAEAIAAGIEDFVSRR